MAEAGAEAAPPSLSSASAATGSDTAAAAAATTASALGAGCSREELQRVLALIGQRDDGGAGDALVREALARVLQERPKGKEAPQQQGAKGSSNSVGGGGGNKSQKTKKKGQPREFDFSRVGTRQIALQLSYEGDRYLGFATRHDGDEETVEGQLLAALMKTKLIKDRAWACYSRCGRTDKGVSALRQVVGLRVRSALAPPPPPQTEEQGPAAAASGGAEAPSQPPPPGDIWSSPYPTETEGEIDYCALLNRVLPPDVRCLGWAPVPAGFSARFCASHRTYRYFFDGRGLDLPAMQRAAAFLEGEHDFRNFCKMDATAVHSFRRVVHAARILRVGSWRWAVDTEGGPLPGGSSEEASEEKEKEVCCLQIQGQAFLWHMVRCVMAVLLLVGRGLEAEGVVAALLDVEGRFPAKPHYAPAPDGPLVLHDCAFAMLGPDRFHHTPAALARLWGELRAARAAAAVKLARVENALTYVGGLAVGVGDVEAWAAEERAQGGGRGRGKGKGKGKGKGNKKRKRGGSEQGEGMEVVEDDDHDHDDAEAEGAPAAEWAGGRARVPWREALPFLAAQGLAFDAFAVGGGEDGGGGGCGGGRHIPLAERAVGRTYAETVAAFGGRKRALYEAAQAKREAGARNGGDQAFFQRLRGQWDSASMGAGAGAPTLAEEAPPQRQEEHQRKGGAAKEKETRVRELELVGSR